MVIYVGAREGGGRKGGGWRKGEGGGVATLHGNINISI